MDKQSRFKETKSSEGAFEERDFYRESLSKLRLVRELQPYNKLEKKSFREALQAFLAQAFLERGFFDSNDAYKTYRITDISYPSEIDGIYDNIRNDSVKKEKLEAIEELKRLEAEEKRLQERKNILKAKAKL